MEHPYTRTFEVLENSLEPMYDQLGQTSNRLYSYDYNPHKAYYDDFVDFADHVIQNLKENGVMANDVYFFFFDNKETQAYAERQKSNDLNVIGVSNGLLERILEYCSELQWPLYNGALSLGIDIANTFKMSLPTYVFTAARNFLLFHELAHIIQFEKKPGKFNLISENTASSNNEPFDIESHAAEMDADQFAGIQIQKILTGHYEQLDESCKTPEALAELIALSMLGIYFLFDILSQELKDDLYFRSGTHPHKAIRIQWAIHSFEMVLSESGISPMQLNENRIHDVFVKILDKATKSSLKFLNLIEPNQLDILQYFAEMKAEIIKRDWMLVPRRII